MFINPFNIFKNFLERAKVLGMDKRKSSYKISGFSLIEVIITLVIFSVFMITLTRVMNTGYIILNAKSREAAQKSRIERFFIRMDNDFRKKPVAIKSERDNKLKIELKKETVCYEKLEDDKIVRVSSKKREPLLDSIKDITFKVFKSVYKDKKIVEVEIFYYSGERVFSERRNFLVETE